MFKKFTELVTGQATQQPLVTTRVDEEQQVIRRQIEQKLSDATLFRLLLVQIASLGYKVTFQRTSLKQTDKVKVQ